MSDLNEGAASLDAPADETLDVASVASAAPAAEADPSPAAEGEKDSMLSVVRDVVAKRSPGSPAGNTSGADGKGAEGDAPATLDDDGFTDVPFHKHPRFQNLVQQRNELKVPAERYRKIEQFMSENALEGTEVAQAIQLAAQIKRDPQAAWITLKPIVQELLLKVGAVLPDDLRGMVQSGRLTAEAAKLVAQERAKTTTLEGQRTFDQQVAERRRLNEERDRTAAAQNAVKTTVGSWEQAQRDKDPDYAKKAEDLEIEVIRLQRKEGKPDTADGVRKQLDSALKAVNARLAAAAPRRPDLTPVTGGRTAGSPRAEPGSLMEIIQNRGRAS